MMAPVSMTAIRTPTPMPILAPPERPCERLLGAEVGNEDGDDVEPEPMELVPVSTEVVLATESVSPRAFPLTPVLFWQELPLRLGASLVKVISAD
jgi:hypothetical protein